MQVVLVDVFVPSVNQRCKNHCYFNHHFFKAASQEQQKQQKSLTWLSLLLLKQLTRSRAWPPTFSRCKSPAGRIWPHDCTLGHMMSHDCWLRCVKTFFEGNRHLPLPQSKQNCAKSYKINILHHLLMYLAVSRGFFLLSVAASWHISTPTSEAESRDSASCFSSKS